jgi:hypothetical protein
MGRDKKGHNWKARERKVVKIDPTEAKRVSEILLFLFQIWCEFDQFFVWCCSTQLPLYQSLNMLKPDY